jgi:uncharacterized protein YkwD
VSRAKYILSLIAVAAAWMLVASAPASAADCGPVDTQVTGLNEAQMESSITCLINDERSSYGLQPVTANSDLRQAAVSHSNEMINQGYFEHTSPSGLTFTDRIESTGYMQGARTWTVGENLVWGTGPLSTPQALVTAWMNSAPHRENLLRPAFREIGLAALAGTPVGRNDLTGVTVSSEYGYRTFGSKKSKGKGHHKAHKARRLRKKHRRH